MLDNIQIIITIDGKEVKEPKVDFSDFTYSTEPQIEYYYDHNYNCFISQEKK